MLFPSWLAHEVETSDIVADDGYRISFAFNMAGDCEGIVHGSPMHDSPMHGPIRPPRRAHPTLHGARIS